VTAATTGRWEFSPDLLPLREVAAAPWRGGAPARGGRLVDHCHTGWDGVATIDLGPQRPSLRLSASPELRWLHVYSPTDADFFCVEPVSHAPDALNMADPIAHGVQVLQPAETLRCWGRLDIM
jgi:aldose 1-epimerase